MIVTEITNMPDHFWDGEINTHWEKLIYYFEVTIVPSRISEGDTLKITPIFDTDASKGSQNPGHRGPVNIYLNRNFRTLVLENPYDSAIESFYINYTHGATHLRYFFEVRAYENYINMWEISTAQPLYIKFNLEVNDTRVESTRSTLLGLKYDTYNELDYSTVSKQ